MIGVKTGDVGLIGKSVVVGAGHARDNFGINRGHGPLLQMPQLSGNHSSRATPQAIAEGSAETQAFAKAQAAKINRDFGKIPLHFESNQGQTDPQVKFLSRGPGYGLFLTPTEAVMTLQQGGTDVGRNKPVLSEAEKPAPVGVSGSLADDLRSNASCSNVKPLSPTPLPAGERGFLPPSDLGYSLPPGELGYSLASEAGYLLASGERGFQLPSPACGRGVGGEGTTLRLKLQGANPAPQLAGLDEQPDKSHYLIGNDPSQWRKNVSNYARVAYDEVYPGIDLVYYGNQRQLEYDFIVAPNADPKTIKLAIEGADRVSIDPDGNLILSTPNGEIRQHKPIVYQDINGQRKTLEGRYVMLNNVGAGSNELTPPIGNAVELTPSPHGGRLGWGRSESSEATDFAGSQAPRGNPVLQALLEKSAPNGSRSFPDGIPKQELGNERHIASIGFEVAEYDHSQPLVIDPVLAYSTYLGGNDLDYGMGIDVDSEGNAYIVGDASSTDFPTTAGAYQTTKQGGGYNGYSMDAFVAKLSPDGSKLLYSTYFGGTNSIEHGSDIVADKLGNVFVVGTTLSADFPVTPGAINNGGRVFMMKLDSSGSNLIYSAKIGGSQGLGIAVDPSGNAYATGDTWASDTPVTPNAAQQKFGGGRDAFVVKLNPTGTAVIYGTYIGGTGEEYGMSLTIDKEGKAYVTGPTSSQNFPLANPLQTEYHGGSPHGDAFVTVVNPEGTQFVFSGYLGGTSEDVGFAITVDKDGFVLVTGVTASTDFPLQAALQPTFGGGVMNILRGDAFLAKIDIARSSLIFSTYLGGTGDDAGYGIETDVLGNAYVTGATTSPNFPLKNPIQSNFAGGTTRTDGAVGDVFLAKVDASGSKLRFSTYLGGSSFDYGSCCNVIKVDRCGDAYLTGATYSSDFPLQSPLQTTYGGGGDAFVAKILFDDSANLSLSKSAAPDPIITGNQLTYHLTINNLCSKDATGVKVSDLLPPQFAYIRATSTQGICSAQDGRLNCELGKLGPKGSADITVLGTASAPASVILNNQASVSADQEDVDPRNNTASASVQLRTALGVLGNDSDPDGDTLNAKLLASTAHGTLSLNPDGSFSYAPQAGFNGVDTFTYQANDGKLDSNVATVTINVARTNHAPSILSTAPTTGTPSLAYGYQLRATDPDTGDTLAYSLGCRNSPLYSS